MQDLSDHIVYMVEHSLMNLWDPQVVKHAENVGRYKHFDEYQRLKFKLQRQAGHTTVALKIADKYQDTVIIVPTIGVMQHMVRRMGENMDTTATVVCLRNIMDSPENFINDHMRGREEKQIVIFDQTSRMELGDLIRAQEWMVGSGNLLLSIELQ